MLHSQCVCVEQVFKSPLDSFSLNSWYSKSSRLVSLYILSFIFISSVYFLTFVLSPCTLNSHEAELAAAASQPLPDDDDDAFE
jgi:hypothetical protein